MSKVFNDQERSLRVTVGMWIGQGILGWSSAHLFLSGMDLTLPEKEKDEDTFYWPLHTEIMAWVADEPHQPKFSAVLYATMARCELLEMHFSRDEQMAIKDSLHLVRASRDRKLNQTTLD